MRTELQVFGLFWNTHKKGCISSDKCIGKNKKEYPLRRVKGKHNRKYAFRKAREEKF